MRLRTRLMIAAIGGLSLLVGYHINVTSSLELLIDDRERIDGRYIVYTDQGEYEVTDTWLFLDRSASTRYNNLRRGHTCRTLVHGVRIGFLSMYPNIVRVRDCKETVR